MIIGGYEASQYFSRGFKKSFRPGIFDSFHVFAGVLDDVIEHLLEVF